MSPIDSKKIHIHITTYLNRKDKQRKQETMEKQKFFCTLCMNTRTKSKGDDCKENRAYYCPVCQGICDSCAIEVPTKVKHEVNRDATEKFNKTKVRNKKSHTKMVQTNPADLNEELSLLNEVLQVFRDKRETANGVQEKEFTTLLRKDIGVSTTNMKLPNLTFSKTCNISIDNDTARTNNEKTRFVILHARQPKVKIPEPPPGFLKHKSSSIPQMKVEELKYSLKAPVKAKDTIEEVNRLFATVRRKEQLSPEFENNLRPSTRNGPRLLPLVKRKPYTNANKEKKLLNPYKSCQNLYLSSGDGSDKESKERYFGQSFEKDKSNKCIYSLTCKSNDKHGDGENCAKVMCEECNRIFNEPQLEKNCNRVGQFGDFMS